MSDRKYECKVLKDRADKVMNIKTVKLQLIARCLNDVEGLDSTKYLELTDYLIQLDEFMHNPLTTELFKSILAKLIDERMDKN